MSGLFFHERTPCRCSGSSSPWAVPGRAEAGVSLSWRGACGNPGIRLFRAIETDRGSGYLTDIPAADAQWNTLFYRTGIGTVTAGSEYTFPSDFFASAGRKHLLFEGTGTGSGELVLTIRRSGQVVGETSVFMELNDVKDMFEAAVAEDVANGLPPSNLMSRFRPTRTLPADPTESKQLIVFVHGINNTEFNYQNTSESMFKGLYWAGYRGRFAAFR